MNEYDYKVAEAEAKADAAQQLKDSVVLNKLFSALRDKYTEEWRRSPPEHAEMRETLYYRLQALDAVLADLESMAKRGKVTSFNNRSKVSRRV
ncbi:hypothetical protein JNW90_13685 [Micromonospora sp. STR1s_5]|nr:hypothetical protein [Micromonospora sp. STR1s_5]